MAKIAYSLLVPTRERVSSLARLFKSIFDTTIHKDQIEILCAVDPDDLKTLQHLPDLINKYKKIIDIRLHQRPYRTQFLNKDYYNWLAERARGDFMWILGDDLVFYIKEWDEYILERINGFFKHNPSRILCASIKDNTPKPSHHLPNFPCFPMFSKETFKVMGYLLHPKVPTWGADYISYQTFKPINRLLEIHDKVFLNHISYHTRQCEADKVTRRVGNIFNQLKNVRFHNIQRIEREELPETRKRLNKYIVEHANDQRMEK